MNTVAFGTEGSPEWNTFLETSSTPLVLKTSLEHTGKSLPYLTQGLEKEAQKKVGFHSGRSSHSVFPPHYPVFLSLALRISKTVGMLFIWLQPIHFSADLLTKFGQRCVLMLVKAWLPSGHWPWNSVSLRLPRSDLSEERQCIRSSAWRSIGSSACEHPLM